MNVRAALETAQDTAHQMLIEQFDAERGIPMRASSHTDLWPGDRWPEAYIAAGESGMATAVMGTIERSVHSDGAFPHIMQGSHRRGGIETRWIDRQVYRLQGNGAVHLPNGEWVTKSLAPPTQALSALALYRARLRPATSIDANRFVQSAMAHYERRGTHSGMIAAHHRDELTSSTSEYFSRLKQHGSVVDPAINALMVSNNRAIVEYAAHGGLSLPHDSDFKKLTAQTERGMYELLMEGPHKAVTSEEVLAIARWGMWTILTEERLDKFFAPPDTDTKHPERSHLNLAMTIEVARLTAHQFESSHSYLERVLSLVAEVGAGAMTEYEGSKPRGSAVLDKYERKHLWLPTAAEIAQIDANSL